MGVFSQIGQSKLAYFGMLTGSDCQSCEAVAPPNKALQRTRLNSSGFHWRSDRVAELGRYIARESV